MSNAENISVAYDQAQTQECSEIGIHKPEKIIKIGYWFLLRKITFIICDMIDGKLNGGGRLAYEKAI